MRSARSRVSTQISWPRWKRGDILAAALAVLITIYGGLLRFEALHGNYSQLKQPQWVRALADYSMPLARALRPYTIAWGPHPSPFVGGDPQNYLRFAREMTSFYQAHVREPMFLALTRTYLWIFQASARLSSWQPTQSMRRMLGHVMRACLATRRSPSVCGTCESSR